MTLDEGGVYYWTKTILRQVGVNVFGGDPPGGTNDLHRVELRIDRGLSKGSKGSRQFDLLAYHLGRTLLIELKDDTSKFDEDIARLEETVSSALWAGALWDSLQERALFERTLPAIEREDLVARRRDLLVRCLGAPPSTFEPPPNFLLFEVAEERLGVRVSQFEDSRLLGDLERWLKSYRP